MKAIIAILLVASVGVNVDASFFGHDYERTALGDSIDKASLKLLKEAYTSANDKNVIASPLGVLMLLSLYSAGAGAGSRQEISAVLGGSDYKTISDNYIGLSQEFANMNPEFLTLANKVYIEQGYALDANFSATARSYRSDVESIEFKDAQKAAGIINKWSDEKTKGHIKEPVSPDILTPDTVVGLFNIIFFQGHWHVPFNATKTKDEDFHVDKNTTVKKPTMHLQQSLFYTESEELGARMVELPYKEDGFRMVVVLPNEVDGLPLVLEKAAQKGLLEDVFNLSPSGQDVKLQMPKFEIQTKSDLNELLPKVGVSKIFTEAATGIVNSDSVVVSKAFQEAFVKVDEEGATAGAFTGFLAAAIDSFNAAPPSAIEFRVDHPFLFLILHQDKILFAGFVMVALSSFSEPPPPMDFKVDHPFLFLILHKDKVLFAGTYTK